MASGGLDGGLQDPCESEFVDVTSGLTMQQRVDLIRSSQRLLKMIKSGQIREVLGMTEEGDGDLPHHDDHQQDGE